MRTARVGEVVMFCMLSVWGVRAGGGGGAELCGVHSHQGLQSCGPHISGAPGQGRAKDQPQGFGGGVWCASQLQAGMCVCRFSGRRSSERNCWSSAGAALPHPALPAAVYSRGLGRRARRASSAVHLWTLEVVYLCPPTSQSLQSRLAAVGFSLAARPRAGPGRRSHMRMRTWQ